MGSIRAVILNFEHFTQDHVIGAEVRLMTPNEMIQTTV